MEGQTGQALPEQDVEERHFGAPFVDHFIEISSPLLHLTSLNNKHTRASPGGCLGRVLPCVPGFTRFSDEGKAAPAQPQHSRDPRPKHHKQ